MQRDVHCTDDSRIALKWTQAHDEGWSVAEQTATDYGKTIADAKFTATEHEKRWYLFSQLFRLIMRNHDETVGVCRVYVPPHVFVLLLCVSDPFLTLAVPRSLTRLPGLLRLSAMISSTG